MTAPNIPELRRLLAEATPGPWEADGGEFVMPTDPDTEMSVEPAGVFGKRWRKDAALIVALRNDTPALLDLLDDMATDLSEAAPGRYGTLARYRAMCGES